MVRTPRPLATLLVTLLAASSSGCDVGRIAARSSASISRRATPALEAYFDYEIAGHGMPSTILQLESMIRVDPENRTLLLSLAKTYVGYAYGWVEDHVEALELEQGDYLAAAEERARAHRMYSRARDIALFRLSLSDDGGPRAMARGERAYARWLAHTFRRRGDAPGLFYAGAAWASAIGTSESGLSDAADLPFARLLVERSVELDPEFQSASGLAFLAAIEASVPDGDLERSRALFERALAQTDRHAFAVLVNMANSYAVQTEDRALYEALLREVLTSEDARDESRLANLIARRRARRYLARIDSRFP